MKPKPLPEIPEKIAEKFWELVQVRGPEECWPWVGRTSLGYGQFRYDGRDLMAHRVSYTLRVGKIPDGLTIDHVRKRGCTMKLCCNDAHLEPVTQSINVSRYNEHRPKSYVCPKGHVRETTRGCRVCSRLYMEAIKAKDPIGFARQVRHRRAIRMAETNAARLYALTCPKGHAKVFDATHCRQCSRLATAASRAKYKYDWGAYKRAQWEKLKAEDPEGYAAKRLAFNRDKRAKQKTRKKAVVS